MEVKVRSPSIKEGNQFNKFNLYDWIRNDNLYSTLGFIRKLIK